MEKDLPMAYQLDDRNFVIGLSELFRQEMKRYEVASLLPLAETSCAELGISPVPVPIEGYYSESQPLQRFFLLIRALQHAEMGEVAGGSGINAVRRLREVFGSPAMGRVEATTTVLPRSSSPFGEALRLLPQWTVAALSLKARELVRSDDAGLVAVAAASGDPVALCVARESAALASMAELAEAEPPSFVWHVSDSVALVASRFVSALAQATGITLPVPEAASSQAYGHAAMNADIVGRCIMVGERPGSSHPYYHWYIDSGIGPGEQELVIKDFWSSAVWTTESLRQTAFDMRPGSGAEVGAPGEKGRGGGTQGWTEEFPRGRDTLKEWAARLFRREGKS